MIHTDICCLFLQYLGMVNNILLHTVILFMKSLKHWKCLKAFKAKVENQLNKRIKCVKFRSGGEYYSKYGRSVNNV